MAAKALFAATLVLGIVNILIAPGMPLNTALPHGTTMLAVGGLTAIVGAVGLALTMKK